MSEDRYFDPVALGRLHKLGGGKLVGQMLEIFFRNAPQRIESARQGQMDGDIEAVERGVHSLRSSAGNVGALALMDLAGEIESLAEGKTWEGVPELLDELEVAYLRVEVRLKEELKGIEA